MQVGKGKDALGNIPAPLIEYTANHIKAEEDMMMKHNYPDFLVHKN